MKINATDHTYSRQVESFFRNERFTAPGAIGMQSQVSSETISNKSESLRNDLAAYDLRKITPNELANLASKLFEAGEISDSAASEFMMVALDQANTDKPIDAIDLFETKFSNISKYRQNDSTLAGAQKISSDALHTLYNLDDFIRGSRESLGVDTMV
jgi:hypothetical protein